MDKKTTLFSIFPVMSTSTTLSLRITWIIGKCTRNYSTKISWHSIRDNDLIKIRQHFGGDVEAFLQQNATISHALTTTMNTAINEISRIEASYFTGLSIVWLFLVEYQRSKICLNGYRKVYKHWINEYQSMLWTAMIQRSPERILLPIALIQYLSRPVRFLLC